jgi:hypothetical protein
LAIGFGTFITRVENERRAAEAIGKVGGTIVYDWQIPPPGAPPGFKPHPPGSQWLRSRLGPHWFDSIVEVQLNGFGNNWQRRQFSTVSRHLVKLRSLRELAVSGQDFNQVDYHMLGQMTQVEVLRLMLEQEIREEDARALTGAVGLRKIDVRYARVSAAALRQLAGLPFLESLKIDCDSYDRQTGKRLAEWQIRDDAAAAIATLPRLREVMLFATEITDSGLAKLCRLSQLETLVVGSRHITSASFEPVAQLSKLEHLGTWGWRIDDDDIDKLAVLPNLRSLGLQTELTDASVPLVTALPHVRRLTLRGAKITEASVPHLQRLSRLEWLDLSDTSIDKLGPPAAELRAALPKCLIFLPKTKKEVAAERAFNHFKWGGGPIVVKGNSVLDGE